jgi:hypothetical protein
MPVGERAAQWVTWNHFYFPASTGFLHSHLFRRRLPSTSPRKSFLAGSEACKIAAASIAPVRRGAEPQLDHRAPWRPIILLRPGAQFHAQTFRAARVRPSRQTPDAGQKPGVALGKNAGHRAQPLRKASQPGDTDVSRTAFRTDREGHLGFAPCRLYIVTSSQSLYRAECQVRIPTQRGGNGRRSHISSMLFSNCPKLPFSTWSKPRQSRPGNKLL